MHWADVIAKDIAERCDKPLIATGISPSGEIHVGSLRESVTGESVRSALEHMAGQSARLYGTGAAGDTLVLTWAVGPDTLQALLGQAKAEMSRVS